jgi:hypothetical protein
MAKPQEENNERPKFELVLENQSLTGGNTSQFSAKSGPYYFAGHNFLTRLSGFQAVATYFLPKMAKKYNSCGQHSAIIEENQKIAERSFHNVSRLSDRDHRF